MQLEENVPLAPLTTLEVGGPARLLARCRSADELRAALDHARRARAGLAWDAQRWLFVGGGEVVAGSAVAVRSG